MNWVDQTLADFGRGMRIPNLEFSDKGVAQLRLQSGGLIAVERCREQVLIYIAEMLAFEDAGIRMRALRCCDFRNGTRFPLQAGVTGSGVDAMLLLLTRVTEREFTLPMLTQALDHLRRVYDDLQQPR